MAANTQSLAMITDEIASSLKKELDEPFKRILADKVDAWRSTLIRQTLQRWPKERKHFRQTIFVPLVEVQPVPDCVLPDSPVCGVMRSASELPISLRVGDQMYDYVGSVDGRQNFYEIAPGMAEYATAGKYSRKRVLWEPMNRNVDILNSRGLPVIRVDGVFSNPRDVARFNCTNGNGGCDFWNDPYPVTGDIKQQIVQYILQVDYGQPVVPANKEIQLNPQKQAHEPDGR